MADVSDTGVTRSNVEQVAIVLLGLGENLSSRVLQKMSIKSVSKLSQVVPKISGIVESELEQVMSGLLQESDDAPLFSDKRPMAAVMRKAMGEKRASELLQSEDGARYSGVLEKLHSLDESVVARMIAHEHPQLQTVVLACIDSGKCADLLSRMEPEVQQDLVCRLANLSSVPTLSLDAVSGLLEGLTETEVSSFEIRGTEQLAEALNHLESDAGDALLDSLKVADQDLAEEVMSLRFTFDHVLELEFAALRILLENVDAQVLALALRGIPTAQQEYVYSCLGKRAAAALRDEVESGVSVRSSRVMEARASVTAQARRLASAGQIELTTSTEEMVS